MIENPNADIVQKIESNPPYRLFLFVIISLALLMQTIDSTIVATALHAMQNDFKSSVALVGWTLTAYSFGFVLMLPLSAKLSIKFGHKKIFIISVFVFTLTSWFCGLATNIYVLIAMRVLQAMGGAGITPAATGIIVDYFGRTKAQYLGLFGSIFASGAMIGPIFGGVFVTYWSWEWIFYINIPIGLIILLLAIKFIPKDNLKVKVREKMDLTGMALMGLAILFAMGGATYLAEQQANLNIAVFIGLFLAAAISTWALFKHLGKVPFPFINLKFIIGKNFGAVNLLNVIHSGMTIGANSLVPLYAINRYGISELHSGTLLVANGIASVVLSSILSVNIHKTGYRKPLYVGSLLLTCGVGLLSVSPLFGIPPYYWLMGCTLIIGASIGTMSPSARNAGLQLAPDQSANIAAIRSLGMQMGYITSVALATTVVSMNAANSGSVHAMVYLGLAIVIFLTIPVISKIQEVKGSW